MCGNSYNDGKLTVRIDEPLHQLIKPLIHRSTRHPATHRPLIHQSITHPILYEKSYCYILIEKMLDIFIATTFASFESEI